MDPILIAVIIVVIVIAVALGVVVSACVKQRKKGKEVPRESKSHDELIDESRKRIESNYKRCRALLELYQGALSEEVVSEWNDLLSEMQYCSPAVEDKAEQHDEKIADQLEQLAECLSGKIDDMAVKQRLFEIRAELKMRAAEI